MKYEKTMAFAAVALIVGGPTAYTYHDKLEGHSYSTTAPALVGSAAVNAAICAKTPDLQHPVPDVKLYKVTQSINTLDIAAAATGYTTEQKVLCTNAYKEAERGISDYRAYGSLLNTDDVIRNARVTDNTYTIWIKEPVKPSKLKPAIVSKLVTMAFNLNTNGQPNYGSIKQLTIEGYGTQIHQPIDIVSYIVPAQQGAQPWELQEEILTDDSQKNYFFGGVFENPVPAQAKSNNIQTNAELNRVDVIFASAT